MRSVSIRLEDMNRMEIVIGKVAENLHTQVNFDCKKMFDAYPDAVPTLSVMNPAGVCYPAIVERDGDIVTWNVSDSDLVKEGTGEVQMTFIVDETVAKSYIGRIKVTRSLIANGEAPDPIEAWETEAAAKLAEVAQALEDIPQAIDNALEAAKESGEFDGPPGQDGKDGQDGAPGYTPQKGVDYFDGQDGYTPVKGVDYFDGQDGQDGAPGADGVSPTVTVTDITGGHRVVITDADGDHKFDVMDGQDASITDTVTGTTVTITGVANHRYLCGTVTEITITPPQTGMIDVLFTAGNACVLSLPNTVKLPDWFDATALEQGTVYEINIMDGVYGVVGSWT